jgi:CPA1 family monovalent cation:H+ antiporter
MPFNIVIPGTALQVIASAIVYISVPIVLITAGILIGNQALSTVMPNITRNYPGKFLELKRNLGLSGLGKDILTILILALVGLEIMAILLDWHYISTGLLSIPAIMLASLIL